MIPRQYKIYTKALETAEDLLEELGYSEPPISSLDIAIYLGYSMEEITMPKEFSNVAGYIIEKEKKIKINKNDLLEYKIYTIAQQIGVLLLNDKNLPPENQDLVLNKRHDFGVTTNSDIEKAAHYFALNLLIPTQILNGYAEYDERTLSKLFIVPRKAIAVQMDTLK